MKKIKLKYAIPEVGETLYAVGRSLPRQEETSVPKKPGRKITKAPSEAQAANRQRFKESIEYARQAMADPRACAHYKELARQQGRVPWRVAAADYLLGINLLTRE